MQITTFSAFKSRNYRLFFAGQAISLVGTWMQKTAVSWIVYSLTHSKLMLGMSLLMSQLPSFLFSLWGGVVSDRYNRYKVLLTTQVASMIQAVILAAIVLIGHYNVWTILSLSVVLGIINAFDVPARQSLVYEMIDDKKDLPNALALNSSMVNLARLIGPAIAGFVLEKWGDGICFVLNAVSFVAVIGSLLLMRLPKYVDKQHTKKALEELREGYLYLKNTPSLSFVIVMLGLISLFVLPYSVLLPVYARDIFKGTASTYGILDSVIGVGALTCAIYLASLKPGSNLKKVLAINTLVLGTGLILFSHEGNYPLALVFAAVAGFGTMSQVTVSNTIIQTTADPAMRGRVISFYAMAFFGMQPLGGILIGSIAEWIGTPDTLLAEGVCALLIAFLHFRFLRKQRLRAKEAAALPAPGLQTA